MNDAYERLREELAKTIKEFWELDERRDEWTSWSHRIIAHRLTYATLFLITVHPGPENEQRQHETILRVLGQLKQDALCEDPKCVPCMWRIVDSDLRRPVPRPSDWDDERWASHVALWALVLESE